MRTATISVYKENDYTLHTVKQTVYLLPYYIPIPCLLWNGLRETFFMQIPIFIEKLIKRLKVSRNFTSSYRFRLIYNDTRLHRMLGIICILQVLMCYTSFSGTKIAIVRTRYMKEQCNL